MRYQPRSFANHSVGYRRQEPAPISIPVSPNSSIPSPQKQTPKLLTSAEMAGLLQPLPVPHTAWSHISMDFVEGLPKSVRELPDTDADGLMIVTPVAVLEDRVVHRHTVEVCQILVQWSSGVPQLQSWEDLKFVRAKFPTFDPWGQGSTRGGGIVMVCAAELKLGESEVKGKDKKLGFESELGKKGGKQRVLGKEKGGMI